MPNRLKLVALRNQPHGVGDVGLNFREKNQVLPSVALSCLHHDAHLRLLLRKWIQTWPTGIGVDFGTPFVLRGVAGARVVLELVGRNWLDGIRALVGMNRLDVFMAGADRNAARLTRSEWSRRHIDVASCGGVELFHRDESRRARRVAWA